MPIFIKALPLSLNTFWRYLIILPFLAIAAFVVSLAGIIPILGLLVPGIVSAGLTIVGLRCALGARGHVNVLDMRKFFVSSLIFCVIGALVGVLSSVLTVGLVWGAKQIGIDLNPLGLLVGLFGVSFYWSALLLALLSPTALAIAVLAVPMTASAHAATTQGKDVNVFFGLGAGVLGLMVPLAVGLFGGHIFAIFGEVWAVFGLISSALGAWHNGEPIPWELSLSPWSFFGGTLFTVWSSSWFFSTAVLTWERVIERNETLRVARIEENRVSNDDLRELRKGRMRQ